MSDLPDLPKPLYVPSGLLGRLVGRRLNSVVFSMDHVMLWFDGDSPSGGNVVLHCDVYPVVERARVSLHEADLGYGDALRAFIPQEVISTAEAAGTGLEVDFATGRILLHPTYEDLVGPEIATLSGFADENWIVWRAGEGPFEVPA